MSKEEQSPLEMIEGNIGKNESPPTSGGTGYSVPSGILKHNYDPEILRALTDIKQELKDLSGRLFAWYIGTTIILTIIFVLMGGKQ